MRMVMDVEFSKSIRKSLNYTLDVDSKLGEKERQYFMPSI
jgi:hypothetical protein